MNLLFLLLLLLESAIAERNWFAENRLIIFGDSLSSFDPDTKTVSTQKRRSNGLLWPEYIQGWVVDYALPGAVANATWGISTHENAADARYTLPGQVDAFLNGGDAPIQQSDCFLFFIGSDDAFQIVTLALKSGATTLTDANNADLRLIGTAIGTQINKMISNGARCFFVATMPDPSVFPFYRVATVPIQQVYAATKVQVSRGISDVVASISVSGVMVTLFDQDYMFKQALAASALKQAPERCLAYADVTQVPPYNVPFNNCTGYFWFDGWHPTTQGHQWLAQWAFSLISNQRPAPTCAEKNNLGLSDKLDSLSSLTSTQLVAVGNSIRESLTCSAGGKKDKFYIAVFHGRGNIISTFDNITITVTDWGEKTAAAVGAAYAYDTPALRELEIDPIVDKKMYRGLFLFKVDRLDLFSNLVNVNNGLEFDYYTTEELNLVLTFTPQDKKGANAVSEGGSIQKIKGGWHVKVTHTSAIAGYTTEDPPKNQDGLLGLIALLLLPIIAFFCIAACVWHGRKEAKEKEAEAAEEMPGVPPGVFPPDFKVEPFQPWVYPGPPPFVGGYPI